MENITAEPRKPARHGRLRTRLSLQNNPDSTWKDRKPIHVGSKYHELCTQLVLNGRFKSLGEAVEAGIEMLVNQHSSIQQIQEQN